MLIGTVEQIWRYPVKSMAGQRLIDCTVGPLGLPGDRGWAIRDELENEIKTATRIPLLMQCASEYCEDPSDENIPHVNITFPDGSRVASDNPQINLRLSEVLEKKVRLSPRQARDCSLLPALPTSPPGTYFDAFPIHVLTTASLAAMRQSNPAADWDVRRFRPNFFVKTADGLSGLLEADWVGKTLRIGSVEVKCEMPALRCGMTTNAQVGLPRDNSVLRTIVKEAEQNLGVYASVSLAGRVAEGDRVELLIN